MRSSMSSKFYTYAQCYGQSVLTRGYDNGIPFTEKVAFKPTLYIKSDKPSKYKSLYDSSPLSPVKFDSIREMKDFIERYDGVDGFEVNGFPKAEYQWINENYKGDIDYNMADVNILFLDIETVDENDPKQKFPDIQLAEIPIVLISLYGSKDKNPIVLGLKDYDPDGEDIQNWRLKHDCPEDDFEYIKFDSEKELLKYFVCYNQLHKFDVWSGWNSEGFDTPYIVNRIHNLFDEKMVKNLSPFGIVRDSTIEIRGKEVMTYDIYGIVMLDLLELYKKLGTYSAKESYALGAIAELELGETKVELPGISFWDNYVNFPNLFVRYSMVDTMLVQKLNNKMQLIELAFSIAYMYHCNIQDVFRTVVPWEVFIFNHLESKNIVMPPKQANTEGAVIGGWVKDPVVGMHGWVLTLDFKALYPSVIRQWNISPETFHPAAFEFTIDDVINKTKVFLDAVDHAKSLNLTLCANGTMFSKDHYGFFPTMMTELGTGRDAAKKTMLEYEKEYQRTHDESITPNISNFNNRQLALKTGGNSGYGATGQSGFYFYDPRISNAITLTGQLSDQHLAHCINKKLNAILKTSEVDYVIYGDTDSLFVSVHTLVEKFYPNKTVSETTNFLDNFAKTVLQPVINASVDELFESMNAYTKVMASKREAIASKTLLRAKKNYAMYVHNSEGVAYDPPKLKVQGLEIVRASTPKACKKWLKECVQMMFENTEMEFRDRYLTIKDEFYKLNPEEISFPRGLNDMDKWADKKTVYKKKTPIHVRGALLYNKHIEEDALNNSDKIKFCYLKVPNTIRENVISYPTAIKFPESLVKFIDKDTMFEKTFASPLRSLTDPAGWQLEEVASLEDFFG